ncbi:MAG: FkbM family methyltransferase [Clostridiales bacterium]|nr:FkbM family methyltransferase [Clostridiales bacterium]
MDIWQKLKRETRPILLYGMGLGAELMLQALSEHSITPVGFFASDGFVRGHYFKGKKVLSFKEAKTLYPDMIALVSFGTQRQEVIDNILSLDIPVFAPEVPVVEGPLFTYEFAKSNKEKIEKAYSLLSDEQSKKVFKEIIEYKLDGEIRHLINAESTENEMISLFNLNSNEMFLDLGAYNGDTVIKFTSFVNNYREIFAIEPDIKNYNKLVRNTQHLKDITYLNKAVSDKTGEMLFSQKGGRNSREGGKTLIECINVDSLNKEFSFIKMDVEGQEANAVLGAKKQIQKGAKMLISAYHRSEDIFEIPLLVHSINPNYKVYLRHLKYIPAWDTNYCFI